MARILLVEDEAVNRLYLRHILSRNGFTIIEARDGFEAVDAARAEKPDCILMDIELPRMDGIEAIRQIRSSGPGIGYPFSPSLPMHRWPIRNTSWISVPTISFTSPTRRRNSWKNCCVFYNESRNQLPIPMLIWAM